MNRRNGFLKFMAGLGLGVGVGMIFAPKSGAETRKDLKNKINELIEKAKEIDLKDVADEFVKKVNDLKSSLEDMDKEKVLSIAKKKGEELKIKANELLALAKEKGTPVLEKAVEEVRQKAIVFTKDVLNKLEKEKPETSK